MAFDSPHTGLALSIAACHNAAMFNRSTQARGFDYICGIAYQTPITIKRAVDRVLGRDYVLPAIQREFVWDAAQITTLFDSLLRRYPIGAFLLWQVEAENSKRFTFYEVMGSYHARLRRHNEILKLPEKRAITAILDGQQRLTALTIGLTGTYAAKLPRKWENNADAYPEKHLHLDLCHEPSSDLLEDLRFRFEFLTLEQASDQNTHENHWYPVSHVLDMAGEFDSFIDYVAGAGIAEGGRNRAMKTLARLHQAIHVDPVIAYHEEEDQDIDRVLDIFIRVNSGGTQLSYSDLLLSIATAQWSAKGRNAREEVIGLVDETNGIGHGFAFSKDLVLKAGLVMIDASDVRFKVANFNQQNMDRLEEHWQQIGKAVKLAAKLLAQFGFSERTLAAHSVLIPLADYAYQSKLTDSWLSAKQHAGERTAIRGWVTRGLLKRGVWGSGLDGLLTTLRRVMRDRRHEAFPVSALEQAMAGLGKPLAFNQAEIDDLLTTRYGRPRAYALLSLLYPGVDITGEFHVDHVFPRSRFTPKRLEGAGVPPDVADEYQWKADELANLQLLRGPVNVSKQDALPLAWATEQYRGDPDGLGLYLAGHDLHGLPAQVTAFGEFYAMRSGLMRTKLSKLLGVPAAVTADQAA